MNYFYKNSNYEYVKKDGNLVYLLEKETNKEYTIKSEDFEKFPGMYEDKSVLTASNSLSLVSFVNNLISFEPFQYKPYLKLISRKNKHRCLYIADEVGVGKTFETGIIISELLYASKINLSQNILIICPNMLCKKWQDVLKNNFGLNSIIIKDINKVKGISILSYDSLSRCSIPDYLDLTLLIIDEAHNLNGKRFEKTLKVREQSDYTILISATPLAGKSQDMKNQLRILGLDADDQSPFLIEGDYLSRTLKDEMREKSVECEIQNLPIKNTKLLQYIDICNEIFIKKNTLRRFVGLNMISSSPAAADEYYKILNSLSNDEIRNLLVDAIVDKEFLEENGLSGGDELELEDLIDLNIDISNETIEKIKELISLLGVQSDNEEDSKLERVKEVIRQNKRVYNEKCEHYEFYKKVVIFTNYNATAKYLKEQLGKESFGNSVVINGDLSDSEKWKRFDDFKNPDSDTDILIITNVACEGQDMDFCNTLINYDLTYNPVQLAQRKGRVDRFEIKKPKIFIYNFYIEDVDPSPFEIEQFICGEITLEKYQNSVYPVLLKKLRDINVETGIYYNVIDNVGKSLNIIDRVAAQEQVVTLFKNYLEHPDINTINDIKALQLTYQMQQTELLRNILGNNNIKLVDNNSDELTIMLNKHNLKLMKYLFDGGTLNSHLIHRGGAYR